MNGPFLPDLRPFLGVIYICFMWDIGKRYSTEIVREPRTTLVLDTDLMYFGNSNYYFSRFI